MFHGGSSIPAPRSPREPLPKLGIRLLGNILRISVLLGLVSLSVISEERVDHSDVDRSSDFDTHMGYLIQSTRADSGNVYAERS